MQHLRTVPVLHTTDDVRTGVQLLVDESLPALPVVDDRERFVGVFGEREFLEAVFPAYLKTLKGAAFLPDTLDQFLEQRESCLGDDIGSVTYREHVEVGAHASDAAIAEVFLHHRVLIVPVVDDGRVVGVVSRSDFFRAVAATVLGR